MLLSCAESLFPGINQGRVNQCNLVHLKVLQWSSLGTFSSQIRVTGRSGTRDTGYLKLLKVPYKLLWVYFSPPNVVFVHKSNLK